MERGAALRQHAAPLVLQPGPMRRGQAAVLDRRDDGVDERPGSTEGERRERRQTAPGLGLLVTPFQGWSDLLMRVLPVVGFAVAIAGCQCLVPVDEVASLDGSVPRQDGGRITADAGGTTADAGGTTDAGVTTADAGGTTEVPEVCVRAADCMPRPAPRACFGSTTGPVRSCFNGRCVFDCNGPRTCSTVNGCTTCEGNPTICNMAGCQLLDDAARGRLFRSCRAGEADLLGTFTVRFRAQSSCGYDVSLSDGSTFGSFAMADEFDETVATVTAEPGITCTIQALSTALNRLDVGCGRCQYLLEWP